MAGKIFLIADTHIGHVKASEWRGFENCREHDLSILRSALAPVGSRDTLIIAGDVFFGQISTFDDLFTQVLQERFPQWHDHNNLPFTLKIVEGNHDKRNKLALSRYIDEDRIFSMLELKVPINGRKEKILITHIPVHESELAPIGRWFRNYHGHLHDKSVGNQKYQCFSWEQALTARQIN